MAFCICLIFVVNVGKYTVPYMDPMGCAFIFTLGFTSLNCQHKTFWGCFGPLNDLSWICEKRKAGNLPPNKKKTSSPNWISASGENEQTLSLATPIRTGFLWRNTLRIKGVGIR